MRNRCGMLAVLSMLLCAVQAYAAPAGFVDKKLEGLSISLPADWEVLSKQEMDQLEGKPEGAKIILAATAKAPFPKIVVYDEEQGNLTQADFEALPNGEVERMCSEFVKNVTSRMTTVSNVSCSRQKVAKGSALVMNMDLPESGVRNSTWSFYRGANKITVVSSLSRLGDKAQITQTETALKSIKLNDK